MLSPSVLNSTAVPRRLRICLVVRLIMPWRLPALGVDDLAGPGDLEALFRARFGLQLGHLALLGLTPFWKLAGLEDPFASE